MLAEGALSAGHARAIVSTSDAERLAQKDAEKANSSRDLETKSAGSTETKDADTVALEKSLTDFLGLKVQLAHKGQGGQMRIEYKSLEQLDELCRLLGEKN